MVPDQRLFYPKALAYPFRPLDFAMIAANTTTRASRSVKARDPSIIETKIVSNFVFVRVCMR